MLENTLAPAAAVDVTCTRDSLQDEIAHHETTIIALRKAFDDALAQQLRAILLKKQRLNTLLHIFRLPPELVLNIMECYIAMHRTLHDEFNVCALIRLTHVCQDWRAVALASPGLWTTMTVSPSSFLPLMLKRSQGALIKVAAWEGEADLSSLMHTLRESHRIKSMHFDIPRGVYCELAATGVVGLSAPELKELVLCGAPCLRDPPPMDPPELFNPTTLITLQRFSISGFFVHWSYPLFRPTLTHLSVSVRHQPRPHDIAEVLTALDRMPKLEYLNLRGVLPLGPRIVDSLPEESKTVLLPNLTALHLDDPWYGCAYLLNHLTLRQDATIHIELRSIQTTFDLLLIGSTLTNKLTSSSEDESGFRLQPNPLLSLSVWQKYNGMRNLEVTGHTTYLNSRALRSQQTQSGEEPRLRLGLYFIEPVSIASVVGVLCTHLPISEVKSFYMGDLPAMDGMDSACVELGKKLAKVESFVAEGLSAERIFNVLGMTQGGINIEDAALTNRVGRIRLPMMQRLREITMASVAFKSLLEEDTDADTIVGFRRTLRLRKDASVGVDRLALEECEDVDAQIVASLKEVVDVTWDGVISSSQTCH